MNMYFQNEDKVSVFVNTLKKELSLQSEVKRLRKQLTSAMAKYYPEEKCGLRAMLSGTLKAEVSPQYFIERATIALKLHNESMQAILLLKKQKKQIEEWVTSSLEDTCSKLSPEDAFFLKQGIRAYENWKAKEDGRPSEMKSHKLLGYPALLSPVEVLRLIDKFKEITPTQIQQAM